MIAPSKLCVLTVFLHPFVLSEIKTVYCIPHHNAIKNSVCSLYSSIPL